MENNPDIELERERKEKDAAFEREQKLKKNKIGQTPSFRTMDRGITERGYRPEGFIGASVKHGGIKEPGTPTQPITRDIKGKTVSSRTRASNEVADARNVRFDQEYRSSLGHATGSRGRGSRGRDSVPQVVQPPASATIPVAPSTPILTRQDVKDIIREMIPIDFSNINRGPMIGPYLIKIPGTNSMGWAAGGGTGAGGQDYDYVFVGTKKVTPPAKTSNFLKVMLDGSACSWVGAMPETQDSNAVVIDVTKNRLYLSGEFGGE